ncbi:hypothetical protein RB195_000681 [Necator americanus]|uniref:Uncharacterized protein n=1 Tax=Necator americanus TaxID=51031 RepID=A0ABR1DCK8_NECAM
MIADVTKRLSLMWGTVDGSGDGRSRLMFDSYYFSMCLAQLSNGI